MIYKIGSIFITGLAKLTPWILEMDVHARVRSETEGARSNRDLDIYGRQNIKTDLK
jgi:hypothetical protein